MEPRAGALVGLADLKSGDLLRGLRLHIAMLRFGALFSTASSSSQATSASSSNSAPSSQQYYKKSIRADKLSDFISHNWVTSRAEKFLCLALQYNLTLAICASWGVAALCCVLTLVGVFPVVVLADSATTSFCASSLGGQVAFFVTFFCAQDFWHLLRRLGLRGDGRLLFVDKACINQEDPTLKREGIESLAGFLVASQNVVVVFGPEYLYKLWTVYELATFVMAHNDHTRITVLPTMWLRQHCALVVGLTLAHLLYYVAVYSWFSFLAAVTAYLLSAVTFCALAGYFIRQWQRQLADITAAIETFSIRKTQCAVESDRIQVQENVRAFLLCLGRVSEESAEDALDEFDKLVREVLPRALVESIGPTGTPYSHLIACSSLFMGAALDNLALRALREGEPWWGPMSSAVFYASACLTLLPLAIFLAQKILSKRLHLRGCAEGLFIAAALLPGMGLYLIGAGLENIIWQSPDEGEWPYFVALLLYCALTAVATVAVYAPNWRRKGPSRVFCDDAPADTDAVPLTPPIPKTSQWRARSFGVDVGEILEEPSRSESDYSIFET